MAKGKPQPTIGVPTPGRATPAVAPSTEPKDDEFPVWRMRRMDMRDSHNLGWGRCKKKQWVKVLERMGGCEQLTFAGLAAAGSHPVEGDGWTPRLAQQLKDDGMPQVTEVFSVRVEGAMRVLCFQEGRVLYLRWFDPGHVAMKSRYRGRK